uniref:Uncharacterized protein n=1 Tax=Cacopsylla melanoneura TaxID=428564 RepID=A0A8D8LFT8_9HEMI
MRMKKRRMRTTQNTRGMASRLMEMKIMCSIPWSSPVKTVRLTRPRKTTPPAPPRPPPTPPSPPKLFPLSSSTAKTCSQWVGRRPPSHPPACRGEGDTRPWPLWAGTGATN